MKRLITSSRQSRKSARTRGFNLQGRSMEGDSQQETAVAASEPSDELVCRKAEQTGFYPLVGKRLVDIVFSSVGLIILSPLLVFVAILIKTSSAGSVFFVQERVGRRGKPFRVIKYRSMRAGSD